MLEKLKSTFLKLFLVFSFAALASCSDKRDENTWLVGTSPDNPPYEFIKDGKVVGFDVDLMNEIGRHLGKKVEFKNMEFHGLLAALATNSVDFVVAGMSVTPERLARVDFSIPYTSAKIAFLHRAEDNFSSYENLHGKKVGAQLGSIWNLIAYDLSSKAGFKVHSLANNLILVEELKAKRIDALILEDSQADKFIEIYPHFAKFIEVNLSSSFAIAMPKNSPQRKQIDNAIRSLKSNGTIYALSKKWGLASE